MSHTYDVTDVPMQIEIYGVPGRTVIAINIATPNGTQFQDATLTAIGNAVERAIADTLGTTLDPVRDDVKASLAAYRDTGRPTGGFLHAVLENDLLGAVARADEHNVRAIPDIAAFCREQLPAIAWASPEHVARWLVLGKAARAEILKLFREGCEQWGVALWHEPNHED